MMWRWIGIVGLVACNVLFAIVLLRTDTHAGTEAMPDPEDLDAVAAYWERQIGEEGGGAAYQRYLTWALEADIQAQHALAHTMGGVLYRTLGTDGLSVCDDSFAFGCYHEFLGLAIHYEGLEVVDDLNDACMSDRMSSVACQHGIGHGILTYVGYDEAALRDALQKCTTFPGGNAIMGCYGGVFMEYNLRTMLSLDGVGMRERGEDVYYPCTILDETDRPACYHWLPQWWTATSEQTIEDTYAEIGGWCRAVEEARERRQCFEGVGNMAVYWSDYVPDTAVTLCTLATDGEAAADRHCRSAAAKALFSIPATRPSAFDVCTGLSAPDLAYCREYGSRSDDVISATLESAIQ